MVDHKKIILALDYDSEEQVYKIIDNIDPKLCRLKIGKELFTKYGPSIIHSIHERGFEIFLDLKFHDIPTTVYKACMSAYSLNIWMLNVHLSGGLEMSKAAVQAKKDCQSKTKLIGVTVLTSLSDDDCLSVYGCAREEQLQKLKNIGISSDVDGYVCSPYDIYKLDADDKLFVTPGIRLNNNKDDHNKVITPKGACDLGSNYLVIGRGVTQSDNPNETLASIINSL